MHNALKRTHEVHAFKQTCWFAGGPHEAERVKAYAIRNHKGKLQTFASASTSSTGVTAVQKALTAEFTKWIASGDCPLQRLEEIAELMQGEHETVKSYHNH